ncbi:MAG: hypothetical protein KKA42_00435 [candidate division Zixibacteria bacterium]|nr:hypothetical protein [candidate division Zixibacteria bacterium]
MSGNANGIGRLFVLGFPGEIPPPPFLDFIAEERIGGVILFADNCPTHLHARENIERIRAACSHAPLIMVDQEGGRVCRLKGAPAEFPSAASYGHSNNLERFREDYRRALVLLDSLGIDLNLAPVADIRLNNNNACLKDRCFGSDPRKVAEFVGAAVSLSREVGMLSCLKHFPGLGAAEIDPHLRTTEVDFDSIVYQQREKIPFQVGVEKGADLIMTTHMHAPALDNVIVTGSKRVIQDFIRDGLGFDGPVITDDLLMKGADVLGEIGERTIKAFRAGHDYLLFGQDYERAMRAYDCFVESANRGEIPEADLQASFARVAGIRLKLGRSAVR